MDTCRGPDVKADGSADAGNGVTQLLEVLHVFGHAQLVAGRFRIIRFIACGGMGEVYEAFDEKLHLRVALKTLRPELSRDAASLERFRSEIRIAREVAHENLCRVYDLVEHRWTNADAAEEVVSCLTMELVEGESLSDYIAANRPIHTQIALPVIAQVAAALEHLHKHGIIHRDLKPSNVMLSQTPDGRQRAVLMDFGLAKPAARVSGMFESAAAPAGTPYFMAPEVMRGERPTAASDIYALGLVIDEMVTRSRAFPAHSVEELYRHRLHRPACSPRARASDLPPEWERTILRCLEDDPSHRYGSACEVYGELASGQEPTAALGAAAAAAAKCAVRGRTSRRRLAAVVALPALALFAAAGAILSRPLDTSVVVFRTANLTNRADYDYLCAGMSYELARRLAQIRTLSVIPSYEPRSKAPGPPIHAAFLLASQLQESGGRIRFAAQVVEHPGGKLVWSDTVERILGDPLETQSQIARYVVEALDAQVVLGGSDRVGGDALASVIGPIRRRLGFQALPRAPTMRKSAMDAYMRGRYLWDERTLPASLAAIRYFERALAEDPNFALAHAALADTYLVLLEYNSAPALQLLGRAREYARKAVEIGPEMAETHLSLAAVQQNLWDWRAAEENYLTAIRLEPRLGRAHHWYAGLILQFARFDEALQEARRGLELDPFSWPGQSAFGTYLFFAGKTEEAAAHLEQVLQQHDFLYARVVLANVYAKLGADSTGERSAEYFRRAFEQARIIAETEAATASRLPSPPGLLRFSDEIYARLYALTRRTAEERPHLSALTRGMEAGNVSPAVVAEIYTALGQYETALVLLETAVDRRDPDAPNIKVNPFFEPLRGSERFEALIKRMQL